MKSSVEQLTPTRVRINVEVPFTELEPDFQRAYKELAKQVRLPGFRPGKAPARLLEARIGREAMLDQVVDEALRSRYGQAVAESEVHPIGQPDIEVTNKEYGQDLAFTAEVDVRPKIELPDLSTLTVKVDSIEVSDDDVDAELQSLRARFGTLIGVQRPVAIGDFVSIDLSATVDGKEVPNAAAEGLSHEVGSGRLIEGLDDALVGLPSMNPGVHREIGHRRRRRAGGAGHCHRQIGQGTRTAGARRRVRPAGQRVRHHRRAADQPARPGAAGQARPAGRAGPHRHPGGSARAGRRAGAGGGRADSGRDRHAQRARWSALDDAKFDEVLAEQGSSREQFDAESRTAAEKDVRTQLLLDTLADQLKIQVGQNDITERLVTTSRQYGIEPQQLLAYLQENNQLPVMFADVRRGLAIAAAGRGGDDH